MSTFGKGGRRYELAFEDFLAAGGVSYVPVTLAQRTAFQAAHVKSFDFVVWPSDGANWVVDIKGRTVGKTGRLDNWVTEGDLEGLARWQEVFGSGFVGIFVFVFLVEDPSAWPHAGAPLHVYEGDSYSFWAICLDDYRRLAKVRSVRWKTCSVPTEVFASAAEPAIEWLVGGGSVSSGAFADGLHRL